MKIEVPRGPGRILASKRVLGGVWAALKSEIVANMDPTWRHVGSKNWTKIEKKSMQELTQK